MVRPDQYSVEQIQETVISACEKLYGEINHDNYFIATDKLEETVREELINVLREKGMDKLKYLDMSVYILQAGKDVFIRLI